MAVSQVDPALPRSPLLDRRVIPEALHRPAIARIHFSGGRELPLTEIICERIKDPERLRDPRQGPLFEWYGILASGEKKRISDRAAMTYASFLRSLTYDDLLAPGTISPHVFREPSLTVTVEYPELNENDGPGATPQKSGRDVLVLGPSRDRGSLLTHKTTGQVFVIDADKVAGLYPPVEELWETKK